MIPRILTGAALTGIVLAAGCGGGSGAGSPAVSSGSTIPSIGGAAPSSSSRGSFTASFSIPFSAARAAAASSRSPQYLSPGTTGLTMLIGNGGTSNVTTGAGTAESATLSTANPTVAANTSTTLSLTVGSFATPPVIGQTLTTSGTGVKVFTITGVSANTLTGTWSAGVTAGDSGIGAVVTLNGATTTYAQTAVIGTTSAALALAPGTTTKSIPLTVNGATATSSVTYSFAPASTLGYYTFSATFSGFTPGTVEKIGVVTTDLSHNNYVLAEGQTGNVTVPAGGLTSASLVLFPVVANIFVPTPTPITAANVATITTNTAGVTAGSLETTVFATDELGYVIPSTSGPSDNGASFAITPATASNLTFAYFSVFAATALTNTSLTVSPTGATALASSTNSAHTALIGITDATSVTGAYLLNILTPSGPFSLATNGASYVGLSAPISTNSAGNPLSITCGGSSSSVAWNAVLTSILPTSSTGLVTGYTYTPGVNYPLTGTVIPLTPINCTPGFAVPIS